MKPIIINEGKHLRLRCGATGQPKPHIQWRRDDGRPIAVGAFMGKISKSLCHESWQTSSLSPQTLLYPVKS
jgi:Immunoglobulin I-set domain